MVHRCTRYGGIFLSSPFEQLLGSEVLVSPKNRVYDSTTLSSYPEVFCFKEAQKLRLGGISVRFSHQQ